MLFELAYVFLANFLETKAHGHQGGRTWFDSDYLPTMHEYSIVTCLRFLLQCPRFLELSS